MEMHHGNSQVLNSASGQLFSLCPVSHLEFSSPLTIVMHLVNQDVSGVDWGGGKYLCCSEESVSYVMFSTLRFLSYIVLLAAHISDLLALAVK